MSEKDVAGALGLAQKAGKLSSGDLGVKDALSDGKAMLLVIATDAAPNTVKELKFLAEKASVPVVFCMQRTALGLCIGKAPRRESPPGSGSCTGQRVCRIDYEKVERVI